MEERIQDACKTLREIKKEDALAHAARRLRCQTAVDAQMVLSRNQTLANMGTWFGVPHCCPCVTLPSLAIHAAQNLKEEEIGALHKAWRSRHHVIGHHALQPPEEQEDERKSLELHACYKRGFCTCSPRGQLVSWFWAAAMGLLKHHARSPERQVELTSGHTCLVWWGKRTELSENEDSVTNQVATHIALHYQRPWRPTFVKMEVLDKGPLENIRGIVDDVYVTLQHPSDLDQLGFHTPFSFINTLTLEDPWWLAIAVLSERRVPFLQSSGQVRAKVDTEAVWQVWEGEHAERGKRARRPRRSGEEPNFHEGAQEAEVPPDIDVCDEFLQHMLQEDEGEVVGGDAAAQTPTSDSSTSSESSGSSSESDDVGTIAPPPLPPHANAADIAAGEDRDMARPAVRVRRPESFSWGPFKMTFKPPASYQATCCLHAPAGQAKCTKLGTWRLGEDEALAREQVLRSLKCWCLRGPQHATKASHQGLRGLHALTPEEARLTDEDLEARLTLIAAPH